MDIKWLEHFDSNKIFMNMKLMNQLNFLEGQVITVTYGTLTIPKKLKINDELSDHCVGLSMHFTEGVIFPTEVELDAIIKEGTLQIGPLIGMVMYKNHQKLTDDRLELLKERIPEKDITKGVLFVCSQDWIDVKNKVMTGYYFTKNSTWKKGLFPIPTVIYNRTYMKNVIFKKLRKGDKINVFNNCRLSKLKLWKLLYKEPFVNSHLPFTQTLKNVNSFIAMTNHFNTVYLKPTNLSRGRGIYQAKKMKLGYLIKDTRNRERIFFTKQELEQFINNLTKQRNYIIQQGVPFLYGNKLVDFRVYMQKDETKEWNCSGIYGRVSKSNRVITNLKHSQQLLTIDHALDKFFHLKKAERLKIEQEMIQACKNICTALEKKKQIIADVAIDVVVDKQMKIWILEVQVSYAADERLYELPESINKKVWQTPLYYAKALTGFDK